MHHGHHHNPTLVFLSIVIAIFASYTALDLASSISIVKGKIRWFWLLGGSLAMGVGIWSMHFIGMLAWSLHGIDIYYDVPLVFLSIFVAILASALALYLISTKDSPGPRIYILGGLVMGSAIAGMHYIGIWSMRMNATIEWDLLYVLASLLIAFIASFGALAVAFRLRGDISLKGFTYRGLGGTMMGFAIAGMHYTGMAAMNIIPTHKIFETTDDLLATNGLATAVIIGTILILSVALTGSNIDRALARRSLLNDALQDAIRARDEFMSVASHELKTPLTSIKLQNEMILRNVQKDMTDITKIIRMLESTDKNLNRISRLVDDMLDISRFSTGHISLQKEKFDLSLLTMEVIEKLKPLCQNAGCEVILKDHKEVLGLWDRFRIEQVITNLLTNATKYAAGKPIHISLSSNAKNAVLKVKDFGRGIDPQDHERIFNRFERADLTENLRGMGLGLFIVREIINMHQGDVKITSKLEEGAEFSVELPLA
jgi:diguanylate cyclase